ncbi:MAG: RNase adapter RapZ [Firmicutes bacterium]|nr:RNase adapter RapZ [Bacillota bacterium]
MALKGNRDKKSFILITGLSGAGKSQALHHLEDLGYFSVDNLPPALIPKFAELCQVSGDKMRRVALVCDIRGGELFTGLFQALEQLEESGFEYEILFLEASKNVLIRRFKETRRRHPLLEKGTVAEAIREEQRTLQDIRGKADIIIDTSEMSPLELKEKINHIYAPGRFENNMVISVLSFGYKYGLPQEADLVFDVRFLPNPYYVEALKPLDGHDERVQNYIWRWVITHKFYQKLSELIEFLLPCYIREGKSELVIAFGCTGGRHRSVALADKLVSYLQSKNYRVQSLHRDIDKA